MKPVVLIVDDEPAARYGMKRALETEGYSIAEADSLESAERAVETRSPNVVLLDVRLASESGLDFLPRLTSRESPPLGIIVTAHGSERMAVQAIKLGAYDYLAKPFDVDELRLLVRNAIEAQMLRSENQRLRRKLASAGSYGELIGSDPTMTIVYSLIEKVAQTDVSVLITGESGTGKEVVAREIHSRSRSASGPFVALNCAAMPGDLIESELFGHEKGAFTGAAAKRLGSNETVSSDVRIISATNKPLEREIEQGTFREDLYYRLCVVRIGLPPLRDRASDIPAIAQAFCERFSIAYRREPLTISSDAARALVEYDWPGNVRQLRNCIERAVVLSDAKEIMIDAFPEEILARKINQTIPESASGITVSEHLDFKSAKREFEKKYVEKSLEQAGGNVTRAATRLGMHRQSLQHKIKELGLSKRFVSED